jgi:gas vesicle protein
MTPPSENFGSTAQIMLEVLDKAAVELSKIVTECLEMVAISGLSLQKSLMLALRCSSENYQGFADGKFDELDRKKQDILEQLQKFEESQIEAVEATAKIVREAIIGHAESVITQISQQLDENIPKHANAKKDPSVLLKNSYDMAKPAIEQTFNDGKQKLEQIFNTYHSETESKTLSSTDRLSQQVNAWNTRMSARMEETLGRFEQHLDEIADKLQSLITESTTQINANAVQHSQQAEEVLQKSLGAIDKSVDGWKSGLTSAYEDLGKDLGEKQELEKTHILELLGQNLEEMNLYLTHLSSDHAEKAFETHRSYVAALDKIESACVQRLEHLHEYFSSLLTSYSEQSAEGIASGAPSTEGHRSRLEASLSAHSGQVVDAASTLVAQLKSDLAHNSEFLNEKIETIKNEAVDYFKEQVKDVEIEADRATKEFRRGLSKLEGSVKEIADAGQAAAVTVTAYLGTQLSLDE